MSDLIKKYALIALILFSSFANATEPLGCYELNSGKFTATIKMPGVIDLDMSVPSLKILEIRNDFTQEGNFSMQIEILSSLGDLLPSSLNGTWISGNKPNSFKVTLTDLDAMLAQLQDLGIQAQVNQKFTGKVLDANGDKISGLFTIGLNAKLSGKTAYAKLSGTFKGQRVSLEPCPIENTEESQQP